MECGAQAPCPVPRGTRPSDYLYWDAASEKWVVGSSKKARLGADAGAVSQGADAIAIGDRAGAVLNQDAGSIVLNATGAPLPSQGADPFVVKPVRTVGSSVGLLPLWYNTETGEIVCWND